MQSLEFNPILKRAVWGGARLGTLLAKPIGDATDVSESWEIADHGNDQSLVADGPHKNRTLAQLIQQNPVELFGRHAGLAQFPLLIKFVDAHDRLSVQVHPNDEQARSIDANENGKTEAWVIVDAEPQSVLYAGLKTGVDRATLEQSLQEGTVEDCLHRFAVTAGDCVYIPAGTVHAIGAGILLAEVQQTSDLTFRLYDWDRPGSDGRPRPLHIGQSLACIDFHRGPVEPVVPMPVADGGHIIEDLVRSDFFVMRRHQATEPFTTAGDNSFRILMPLTGRAVLISGEQSRRIGLGQTILVPASVGDCRIEPDGAMTLLEVFLP